MKLTDDERAFIARWLMEFGEEPVTKAVRFANSWYCGAAAVKYPALYDPVSPTDRRFAITPKALAAFNKGDKHE